MLYNWRLWAVAVFLNLTTMESDEQIEEVVDAMDWNFKEFSWQLSDLEQKENGDLGAVVEFGRLESQEKKIESLVDLKLTVADSKQGSLNKLKDGKGPILISSGSSKRKNATKKPSCLVDSCKSDLSNCREYYKRHRVCELHSKTPIVTVKGEEKRFCQQCSRFHSLGEFDEGKRSCRKRLDGHNRRRRKAQPEPFYWNFKNFMSSYKGPRILQFGSPHMYANPIVGNMWPFHTKTDADPSIYSDCNRFRIIDEQQGPANSLNGGNKFFLLQENDTKQGKTSGEFLCQPALNPNNPQGRGRGSHLLSSETVTVPVDLGRCALYLLSSNSTQGSGQSNETHSIQFQDSTDPNTSFSSLAEYPYLCPAKEQAWGPITNF